MLLSEKDKKYLTNFLEPFISEVLTIKKKVSCNEKEIYLVIDLKDDVITLPYMNANEWFVNLYEEEEYTLLELGITKYES